MSLPTLTHQSTPPKPLPKAATPGAMRVERRDQTKRQALLGRVVTEYEELPALCLTPAQAERLFDLRKDICQRVFKTLEDAEILRRDVSGRYRQEKRIRGRQDAGRR